MAIYFAGYLSPIRNKLGNAVGRKWRTLDVLSVYNGRPRNPRTNAQQIVRTKFGVAASLARAFDAAVKIGFKPLCDGTPIPERSMFIKKNFEFIQCDTPGVATVDYTELILAQGSMPMPAYGQASFSEPLKVKATQTDTTEEDGALATDIVRLFVYSPEAGAAKMGSEYHRSTATLDCDVPAAWNGHRVHVWGMCYGADGSANDGKVSDSQYIGTGTIE